MQMYNCYLLYSKKLDKFYIGSTIITPNDRLERHLKKYYGKTKYTALADDWVLFHIIECETFEQSRKIEKHIKRMKSKIYNHNLKKYPEISKKLLIKYK